MPLWNPIRHIFVLFSYISYILYLSAYKIISYYIHQWRLIFTNHSGVPHSCSLFKTMDRYAVLNTFFTSMHIIACQRCLESPISALTASTDLVLRNPYWDLENVPQVWFLLSVPITCLIRSGHTYALFCRLISLLSGLEACPFQDVEKVCVFTKLSYTSSSSFCQYYISSIDGFWSNSLRTWWFCGF